MPLSKTFRASWSIGLAATLLAAVPPGRSARAENIVGDGAVAAHLLDAAASEGAFRHLRALQDIASVSGGNRAAGTPGYDRSAEYVAERLKEAGYVVQLEEFEFPFFEQRVPPVLLVSTPDGRQESAPAAALRTLTNSGSGNVTAPLRAVSLGLAAGPPLASASGCKTTDFEEFERGCQLGALLCYEPNFDAQRIQPLVDAFGDRLRKFEVVNSQELRCFECLRTNP